MPPLTLLILLALLTLLPIPPRRLGDLRSRSGISPVADIAPVVGGTLGSLAPPTIVAFTAADPDNGDAAFGDGDVLTIRFDPVSYTHLTLPTNLRV